MALDGEPRESTSCRIRVLARFRPLTLSEVSSDAVAASVSGPGQRVLKLHAKENVVRWGRTTFAFDSVLYVWAVPAPHVWLRGRLSPVCVVCMVVAGGAQSRAALVDAASGQRQAVPS